MSRHTRRAGGTIKCHQMSQWAGRGLQKTNQCHVLFECLSTEIEYVLYCIKPQCYTKYGLESERDLVKIVKGQNLVTYSVSDGNDEVDGYNYFLSLSLSHTHTLAHIYTKLSLLLLLKLLSMSETVRSRTVTIFAFKEQNANVMCGF